MDERTLGYDRYEENIYFCSLQ